MNSKQNPPSMEAECKYRVSNIHETRRAIQESSAEYVRRENQRDTYLRHPCRNFRETDEAFRIREIDGTPFVTYKGPRLAGPIKIRPEIELPLITETLREWMQIWEHLGFTIAAQVCKTRDVYQSNRLSIPITIALDHVESLGDFVEIERIVTTSEQVEQAKIDIQTMAQWLALDQIESRSYLSMILSSRP
jgi:adenylate cyclase, class 2